MLTISELARLTGTTARAIRHYERLGLLPAPDRRPNGYRSYGPSALIRLVKIKRMQAVGLGLSEIGELLADGTTPPDLRGALQLLDEELAAQASEIAQRRARIARLLAGPAEVVLPPELAGIVDRLAELVADPGLMAAERDALALAVTLAPHQLPAMVKMYSELLEHAPALAQLSAEFAALADAAPDDPRIAATARNFVDRLERLERLGRLAANDDPGDGRNMKLFDAHLAERLSPAQQRCAELIGELVAGGGPR